MRSERSPEPTIDLRAPARSLASRSRSSSNRRVRSTFSALALFLCCDFSSCWMTTRPVGKVGDPDRAVGGVDRLAAGPRRAIDVDAQILVVDMDVDILGFGQHRDGRRRGVDAPAAFGHGHALDAVDAAFELQFGEHARAR